MLNIVLLGHCTEEQDHTISLLKSGRLIQEIFGTEGHKVELGLKAIIDSIERLNNEAEEQFCQIFPTVVRASANLQDMDEKGLHPYCQDARLSLKCPGNVTDGEVM